MNERVLGLDIGGANLKAALDNGESRTRPIALWKHPDTLAAEIRLLMDSWQWDRVALTMTGELCDCFATKTEGVRHILHAVQSALGICHFWRIDGRFVSFQHALNDPLLCAASNWLALAIFSARFVPNGPALLLDIGSTTTDLIPLMNGASMPFGRTDAERLRCGELIYTGVRRTPLCALLGWEGMAEFFATTHDVYILLAYIPENRDDVDTADGRPATKEFAHARLARMLGGDGEITPIEDTMALAARLKDMQISHIADSIPPGWREVPVILSGSGEFLGRAVLERLKPQQVISIAEELGSVTSAAACAYAVATLLAEGQHGP